VVLEDVARRSGLFVERAAALHAQVLGHGDLHVVDVAPVPDRLEDAVAEAEDEDVADRLLAQVVVDAVDLRLPEDAQDLAVERAPRLEVVAEGLLDDDARPAAAALLTVEAGSTEVLDDGPVGRGRRGQVEEPVAARAARGIDAVEAVSQRPVRLGRREVALLVVDAGGEVGPQGGLDGQPRVVRDRHCHLGAVGLVRVRPPGVAEHARLRRQEPGPAQVDEGGQDAAVRQVAGGPEEDDRARLRHLLQAQALAQRVREGAGPAPSTAPGGPGATGRRAAHGHQSVFSACPPNCWRSAASTFAP